VDISVKHQWNIKQLWNLESWSECSEFKLYTAKACECQDCDARTVFGSSGRMVPPDRRSSRFGTRELRFAIASQWGQHGGRRIHHCA
jgi:hypothetical protein